MAHSGNARAIACWFRRLAETDFQMSLSRRGKVRDGEAPSPAREARALPRADGAITPLRRDLTDDKDLARILAKQPAKKV